MFVETLFRAGQDAGRLKIRLDTLRAPGALFALAESRVSRNRLQPVKHPPWKISMLDTDRHSCVAYQLVSNFRFEKFPASPTFLAAPSRNRVLRTCVSLT